MPTPTLAHSLPLSLSFFLLSLASSANAQTVVRRRRSSTSRIVGGVIAGVVFLIFLTFLCALARRRRMRRMGHPGLIGVSGASSKPMFGGPWGRHNHVPPPPDANHNTDFGFGNNAPLHAHPTQQAYNPAYPSSNGGPAPPPYGPGKELPSHNGGSYAPPPGPPPPAHTKGHDGSFVGGFRS